VIKITSRIVVSSNIYIAGQTAPGEGITIYGNGFSYSGANNVICRYLRMRMGAVGDSGKDACGIANGSNMIFDHVSVSWGRDETFSVSGTECINITIQNSLISQGLLSHSAGGLIQTDGGVTLYRNLYVDNDTRNNKIKGVNQYVNNMVFVTYLKLLLIV
jgi:pectate lyase